MAQSTPRNEKSAAPEPASEATTQASPEAEALAALLADLAELRDYLSERGRHTFELAQRFLQNARRDAAERAYDERQATMLEYQNYIWHEIAGRVDQLLARYAGDDGAVDDDGGTSGEPGTGEE
ncbi:MAG TPA: hypothetical protein VGN32_13500 [Ktedonobacterales bacterium]|nr:hypothetical protein [Ktedonobacterales bacterium]